MTNPQDRAAPLAGIRIVERLDGPMGLASRFLMDFGAEVTRIAPALAERSFDQLVLDRGKRIVVEGDAAVPDLLADAHVVVVAAAHGLADLRFANPALVTMVVSPFGTGNTISDWQASDLVLHALSAELCRSGIRGQPPLAPPEGLAYRCASVQAAYALAASLFMALRSGRGDHIDFSVLEGAVQALDPGYGVGGSATMGRPAAKLSPDRPVKGLQYPILACADGRVRICLLSARQWQGMFRWMGEPAQFADPSFNSTVVRYKSATLLPAIGAFFADRTRAQLEEEGQRHGVPIAAVASLADAVTAPHFAARGTFAQMSLPDSREVTVPATGALVDGDRVVAGTAPAPVFPTPSGTIARAFEGLRVLDLGVIVVGAETARLFGDQGADVVKVESRAFPDGNRQSYLPYELSVSFAAGHRNKRGLGLDLRHPEGRQVFLALIAQADVLLSNFKPGTLESLGLGFEALRAANPRLVSVESSAFGGTGPWSRRMGYGPLVRAATGLTDRWRYRDDPEGYSDSITILPDHAAARVGAVAAIALLIRRLRTGQGGLADIAQAEVMLQQFGTDVARASAGLDGADDDELSGVYRAQGADEWCAVTLRSGADRTRFAGLDGLDEAATRESLTGWIAARDADESMTALQGVGVPAARMLRIGDLREFAPFRERRFYRVEHHPYLDQPVVNERAHAMSPTIPGALTRPAPLSGEQSAEVLGEWLGMPAERIGELVAGGIVQEVAPGLREQIADHLAQARSA